MTVSVKAVLLDVGGVVYIGERPLPGALAAIENLKAAGLGLRYITNTTSEPLRAMLKKLRGLGIPLEPEELLPARSALVCRGSWCAPGSTGMAMS